MTSGGVIRLLIFQIKLQACSTSMQTVMAGIKDQQFLITIMVARAVQ